ncbi:MAG: glycosidase [Bacteroidia bacterium]|nr:MAG: glycosidase [Bacteroidia bacterium]
MKLKRFKGNPILSPNPGNDWESLVSTNPGAWYDDVTGEVYLLYRTAGDDDEHRTYFGLAKSKDGYHFDRLFPDPVFGPSADGFDAGCVEDPRVIKMGDWFFVTYASRPYPPGKYWLNDKREYKPPVFPDEFPSLLRNNHTVTGLAITKDFKSFIRTGRLTNASVDNRDVILFPEKINGKYFMLHRPMDWVGKEYGTEFPAMWISSSDDILCFPDGKILAKAKYPWEKKIGGNTPPIRTEAGWLIIYHAVGPDRYYRLGAMLLDLNDPSIVLHRTPDWILQPEEDYELNGFYKGVVFPCGKVVINDTLFVYYGGADKYVGVATCSITELLDHLVKCPA